MKNLVSENLNTFLRGQGSKKALNVGYVKVMPDIMEDIDDKMNFGSDIQYQMELSNHPTVNSTMIGTDNPVYVITGGMEAGHGLPKEDNRIVYFNVYVDPIELTIFGELSLTYFYPTGDITGSEEKDDEDYKYEKRSIVDTDINTITIAARKATYDLLKQANIEIE